MNQSFATPDQITRRTKRFASTLGLALLMIPTMTSCRKDQSAATDAGIPVKAEEVPNRIEQAFESAPAEAAEAASSVVDSARQDDPAALQKLQELSARSDLTPEQRKVANQSMYALLARLRVAQSNGNQRAAAALEQYQATK